MNKKIHPIVREYLAAKRTARWATANVDNAERTLRWFREHLAGDSDDPIDLLDAKPVYVNEYLAERLQVAAPNTVICDHRQLKAFYKWCVQVEYLDASNNPMRGVAAPKGDDPDPARTPVLTETEYRKMMETTARKSKRSGRGVKTCCDHRDAAIMSLLWTTGMRRGELANIEYRDVDWDEMTIHLRKTKGRGKTKSRTVAFDEDTLHHLNRYLLHRGNEDGPLFYNTRKIGIRPQTITLMLRRRAEQAGVDSDAAGCAHAFRRALANDWLAHGATVEELETNMGWKHDGKMSARYARQGETARAHAAARRVADLRSGRQLHAVRDAG